MKNKKKTFSSVLIAFFSKLSFGARNYITLFCLCKLICKRKPHERLRSPLRNEEVSRMFSTPPSFHYFHQHTIPFHTFACLIMCTLLFQKSTSSSRSPQRAWRARRPSWRWWRSTWRSWRACGNVSRRKGTSSRRANAVQSKKSSKIRAG